MPEELKPLLGPYEIFEMTDGETRVFQVNDWKLGTMGMVTAETPAGKIVKTLRLYVPQLHKPLGVNWWDVTSQTLIAQLLPYLELPNYQVKTFTVSKFGVKPKARFTVKAE